MIAVYSLEFTMLTSYTIMHYDIVYLLLSTVCGSDNNYGPCEKMMVNR